jgi:hypothetical protein
MVHTKKEREDHMMQSTALIKFTRSEVQLLINSLHMSISTVVPCVENGEWKKPYEKIQKDLINITEQFIEKEREININVKKEESGTNNPAECYDCSD